MTTRTTVSRREAMKAALKAGAYVAPLMVATSIPAGVAAGSPLPPTTADIAVTQTAVASAGGTIGTFTVTATNLGPSNATSVFIVDREPGGFLDAFVGVASAGTTYTFLSGVWLIPSLLVGGTATLTLTGRLDPSEGQVTNTAMRTASSPTDPNPANDTTTASLTPPTLS